MKIRLIIHRPDKVSCKLNQHMLFMCFSLQK